MLREYTQHDNCRNSSGLQRIRVSGYAAGVHRAFTVIEMLSTVALLVILLGLMVSLARNVRHRSSEKFTRQVLAKLDNAARRYAALEDELARQIPPLIGRGETGTDEQLIRRHALENSQAFVRVFRQETGGAVFAELPLSVYDESTIRDAWGTPIVYMAPGAANIGMAPQRRAFFLSAGPDRTFTTLLDNLYSYEREWEK
ncbi:MAG: type II secretion system protein [Tepidisphaeraceae bacterium]|jgi:type II secretory pathway pseudopilin PulG